MSLLGTWFGDRRRAHALGAPQREAVARWRAVPAPDLLMPLSGQSWLVVDVETTGLDMRRDRLLAIGAVVVEGTVIRFGRSFEVVLRQQTVSGSENILIHRIPGRQQLDGVDAAAALADFLAFSQKLPCVAFHAAFDESMLKRAFAEHLGLDFSPPFVDLAMLAPALVPEAPASTRSLDQWLAHFSIVIHARHRAVADAVGTAQLFQVLLDRAMARDFASAAALIKLARGQRWLNKIGHR